MSVSIVARSVGMYISSSVCISLRVTCILWCSPFCHLQKGKVKPVHLVDVPGHSRLQTKLDDFLPQAAGVVFVVDAVEFLPKSRAVSEYVCIKCGSLKVWVKITPL